jgi:hypothetical protein
MEADHNPGVSLLYIKYSFDAACCDSERLPCAIAFFLAWNLLKHQPYPEDVISYRDQMMLYVLLCVPVVSVQGDRLTGQRHIRITPVTCLLGS